MPITDTQLQAFIIVQDRTDALLKAWVDYAYVQPDRVVPITVIMACLNATEQNLKLIRPPN